MAKIMKIAAAGAALLICSASAHAAMWSERAYVDAELGWGKVDTSKVGATKNSGFTGGISVGWKYTEGLGVEAGYHSYRNINGLNKDNYNYHIAVKALQPVDDKMSVFGKAGMAFARSTCTAVGGKCSALGKQKANVGFFAVGLGYELTPTIDGTASLMFTTSKDNIPSTTAVTAGVSMNF